MSKLINLTKQNNHKNTLRNNKVNRITKQIQHFLNIDSTFTQIDSIHKQNHQQNNNKSFKSQHQTPKKSYPSKNGPKDMSTMSEVGILKAKVIMLEQQVSRQKREKEELSVKNCRLEILLEKSKQEHHVLNQEINQLKKQLEKINIDNDHSLMIKQQSTDIYEEFKQQFSSDMIQLHEQNSKLLSKILELTSKKNQNDGSSQTFPVQMRQKSCQTQSQLWESLNTFLSKKNILVELTDRNIDELLEQYVSSQIKKCQLPLQCELQLFKEIIANNKKQHQQKEIKLTSLLIESQKTIQNLIVEMKKFEAESKMHHSNYLTAVRANKKQQC